METKIRRRRHPSTYDVHTRDVDASSRRLFRRRSIDALADGQLVADGVVGVVVVRLGGGRRSLTDRELLAAVARRHARVAVPAVGADVRRPVADVEVLAAVSVGRTLLAETHPGRQQHPRMTAVNSNNGNNYNNRLVAVWPTSFICHKISVLFHPFQFSFISRIVYFSS